MLAQGGGCRRLQSEAHAVLAGALAAGALHRGFDEWVPDMQRIGAVQSATAADHHGAAVLQRLRQLWRGAVVQCLATFSFGLAPGHGFGVQVGGRHVSQFVVQFLQRGCQLVLDALEHLPHGDVQALLDQTDGAGAGAVEFAPAFLQRVAQLAQFGGNVFDGTGAFPDAPHFGLEIGAEGGRERFGGVGTGRLQHLVRHVQHFAE